MRPAASSRISGVTVDITDRKDRRGAAGAARPRGRSPRQECSGPGAVDRPTDARPTALPTTPTSVEGRIRALSRAHTILSLSRWQGADIRGLVEEELAPYRTGDSRRSSTGGPERVAAAGGRAVHRAGVARAGRPMPRSTARCRRMSGRVHLSWELTDGSLGLQWTESGGPADPSPDVARLWNADHHRQCRRSAWRPGDLRLAFGRAAMHFGGSAR